MTDEFRMNLRLRMEVSGDIIFKWEIFIFFSRTYADEDFGF